MTNIDYENLSVNGFAIHKVDQFLIDTGMQAYKLGLEACGSSNFYDRLLKGKARLATIAQVENYIDEQRKLMHIQLPENELAALEIRNADKATMVSRAQLFFACPHCGADDEHSVTHFLENKRDHGFGPWQCDACGWVVSGKWHGFNQTVTITELRERPAPIQGFMLLRLAPSKSNAPLFFVVEDTIHTRDGVEPFDQEMENKRYWVEEHTCPTNVVRVEAIIEMEPYDDDPHGVLEFVSWAPRPADLADGEQPNWRQLFPVLEREIDGYAECNFAVQISA